MKKRILAFLLAVMMVVSLLPASAFAYDGSVPEEYRGKWVPTDLEKGVSSIVIEDSFCTVNLQKEEPVVLPLTWAGDPYYQFEIDMNNSFSFNPSMGSYDLRLNGETYMLGQYGLEQYAGVKYRGECRESYGEFYEEGAYYLFTFGEDDVTFKVGNASYTLTGQDGDYAWENDNDSLSANASVSEEGGDISISGSISDESVEASFLLERHDQHSFVPFCEVIKFDEGLWALKCEYCDALNTAEPLYEREMPTAKTGLVYNGKEQSGVDFNNDGSHFMIEGESGTDVGEYTARIEPYWFEGVWSDGTQAVVNINWSIAPATDNAITGVPAIKDGSVDLSDVTATFGTPIAVYYTDADCTIKAEEPLEIGTTYYVRAEVEETNNYNDAVSEAVEYAVRTAIDEPYGAYLEYNGEEQVGVKEGDYYTLTGNTATDVGEYTAIASLEPGYCWSDGSTDDKEIAWYIEKANLTVKVRDASVKVGELAPHFEFEIECPVDGVADSLREIYRAALSCDYDEEADVFQREYPITFKDVVLDESITKNYNVDIVPGTFSVEGLVAQTGNGYYKTLADAVAVGGTITLLMDAEGVGLNITKKISLNLQDYTYTVTSPVEGTSVAVINSVKNTTIKNGTIKCAADCGITTLLQTSGYMTLGSTTSSNAATLDGKNISGTGSTVCAVLSDQVACIHSNIIAKSGDFAIETNPGAYFLMNYGSYTGNVNLKGGDLKFYYSGTFKGELVATNVGSGVIIKGSHWKGTVAAPDGYEWVANGADQKLAAVTYAAQIGDAKYKTLAEAIEAAEDGATITLIADNDETIADVAKAVTIDLNDKNFTGTITAGTGYELVDGEGTKSIAAKIPVVTVEETSTWQSSYGILHFTPQALFKFTADESTGYDTWKVLVTASFDKPVANHSLAVLSGENGAAATLWSNNAAELYSNYTFAYYKTKNNAFGVANLSIENIGTVMTIKMELVDPDNAENKIVLATKDYEIAEDGYFEYQTTNYYYAGTAEGSRKVGQNAYYPCGYSYWKDGLFVALKDDIMVGQDDAAYFITSEPEARIGNKIFVALQDAVNYAVDFGDDDTVITLMTNASAITIPHHMNTEPGTPDTVYKNDYIPESPVSVKIDCGEYGIKKVNAPCYYANAKTWDDFFQIVATTDEGISTYTFEKAPHVHHMECTDNGDHKTHTFTCTYPGCEQKDGTPYPDDQCYTYVGNHVYDADTGLCVNCGFDREYGDRDCTVSVYECCKLNASDGGSCTYREIKKELVQNDIVTLTTDASKTEETSEAIITYTFRHWALGKNTSEDTNNDGAYTNVQATDTILSTSLSYIFLAKEKMNIVAVYEKTSEISKADAAVEITETTAQCSSKTSNTLTFKEKYVIPSGYTFKESGFLYATNTQLGYNVANSTDKSSENGIVDLMKTKAKTSKTTVKKDDNTFSFNYAVGKNINDYVYVLPYVKTQATGSSEVNTAYGTLKAVRLTDLAKPQIAISRMFSEKIDASNGNVCFTATRSVPQCYEVVEHGVYYAVNKDLKPDIASVKYDLTTTGNDTITWSDSALATVENIVKVNRKFASPSVILNGDFTLKIGKGSPTKNLDKFFYAVPYVKVRDGNGNEQIIYGDVAKMTQNMYPIPQD